jgi:membrane protein DedA with SNARE-associated domain
MPYRTFLFWNVVGALVWAPTVIAVGYVAGNSWDQVDRVLGWGTPAIVAVLVGAWFVVRQVRRSRLDGHPGEPRSARPRVGGRDTRV